MLEPLALQEFSVPGAVLPFYSRGSQTPTDSTKNPTGGQVEKGKEGGKRRESSYPRCAACKCVLPLVHTGIQVCSPTDALRADCAVSFPSVASEVVKKGRWANSPGGVLGQAGCFPVGAVKGKDSPL